MTKEPHADPVPPDVPPLESIGPVLPAADALPPGRGGAGRPGHGQGVSGNAVPSSGAGAGHGPAGYGNAVSSSGANAGHGPTGYGNPADFETVPVNPRPAGGNGKPVRVGRGTGKLSKRLITAYFAGGLALLLVGTVAVFYLAIKVYGRTLPDTTVTAARDYSTAPSAPVSAGRAPSRPAAPVPPPVEPSSSPRARFGPEKLPNGKSFVMRGEGDARFQVTVKAGKFRKRACDQYSLKPKEGGYLPVQLKVKVLEGEPDISEYAFRFQKPDGDWLPSVGGSGCEGNDYGGFVRRLSAGRTYSSTVVFDIPSTKGDIVFVYPLLDVAASWKIG